MYSLALRLVTVVVLVKYVIAMAVGNVFFFLFASNIMNNFAFKAISTFVLFQVQSRQNRKYKTLESLPFLCFVSFIVNMKYFLMCVCIFIKCDFCIVIFISMNAIKSNKHVHMWEFGLSLHPNNVYASIPRVINSPET